jgi:hypothetical protein
MREKRYDDLTKLMLQGATEREMAEVLHVSRATVRYDKGKIIAHWRDEAAEQAAAAQVKMLHQLEHIYYLAMKAYRDSFRKVVTTRSSKTKGKGKNKPQVNRITITESTPTTGDMRCLTTALQALHQQARIYGLYAPSRIANADGSPLPQAASPTVILYTPDCREAGPS